MSNVASRHLWIFAGTRPCSRVVRKSLFDDSRMSRVPFFKGNTLGLCSMFSKWGSSLWTGGDVMHFTHQAPLVQASHTGVEHARQSPAKAGVPQPQGIGIAQMSGSFGGPTPLIAGTTGFALHGERLLIATATKESTRRITPPSFSIRCSFVMRRGMRPWPIPRSLSSRNRSG